MMKVAYALNDWFAEHGIDTENVSISIFADDPETQSKINAAIKADTETLRNIPMTEASMAALTRDEYQIAGIAIRVARKGKVV